MTRRGHSNVQEEDLRHVLSDSSAGDYALIPIFGGATFATVKELPPLALRKREWLAIGQKMGWLTAHEDLLAALQELAKIGEEGVIERRETGKPTWYALDAVKNIASNAIAEATAIESPPKLPT